MTFNIRNWDRSEGHLYRIKEAIKEYTPDMIGFQEISNRARYEWVDRLLADPEIEDMYGYVGEDRMDSTGEQCAIFYRKDVFKLLEGGTRWLYCTHGIGCTSTDCKGETTPGRFEGTNYSSSEHFRIMTYARLQGISDGKVLTFINTHLETWDGMLEGEHRQTKQVDYILNFAKELTDKGEPVVLTGDFNSYLDSPACQKTMRAGFRCAEREAQSFVGEEIKSGERFLSENLPMCARIDHIFINAPQCSIETYTYCNHKIKYEGVEDYPSDHIPRIATYTLG